MGLFYKIYMVLLINFTVMQNHAKSSTTHLEALESFMNRRENKSSVVPIDDIPAVVGPPKFDVPNSKKSILFTEPAFTQPTYETVFQTSTIPSPPKCGSTVQPESLHVHPEPSLPERVRKTVCAKLARSIKAINFCLAFVGFGFPQFAVLALLTKMGLTCETNGNSMVDIKSIHENVDQFVKSLVQMKEIVDFILAVIITLKKKPIYWTMFLNHDSKTYYIQTSLSSEVLKSVRRCLTVLGFSEGNGLMKVPSTQASLSASQLLEHIWTVVSNYDWESAPQKSAKRGREEEEKPDDAPPAKRQPLLNNQIVNTIMTRIMRHLLSGVNSVSLHEIYQFAFLDLSRDRLCQVMDFLSNPDNLWCLHRILMEMKNLNVIFKENHVFLSLGNGFDFSEFNLQQTAMLFNRFFLEVIMMRQSDCQTRHDESLQEEVRKKQEIQRIERFIKALWTLWKINDINSFFQELIRVSPEFNSYHTNWSLLDVVVGEFMDRIYNATTRGYHKREPCEDPLRDFLQYAITRGVFSPKAQVRENIRICKYRSDSCPFGPTCSGAHQDFESNGWRKGSVWGMCCPEYAERRTCSNRHCRYAHFTGDEYYGAFRNGGKDSNRMRNDLLAQAYIAKRQRTAD
jgi:hypothetical protein